MHPKRQPDVPKDTHDVPTDRFLHARRSLRGQFRHSTAADALLRKEFVVVFVRKDPDLQLVIHHVAPHFPFLFVLREKIVPVPANQNQLHTAELRQQRAPPDSVEETEDIKAVSCGT